MDVLGFTRQWKYKCDLVHGKAVNYNSTKDILNKLWKEASSSGLNSSLSGKLKLERKRFKSNWAWQASSDQTDSKHCSFLLQ